MKVQSRHTFYMRLVNRRSGLRLLSPLTVSHWAYTSCVRASWGLYLVSVDLMDVYSPFIGVYLMRVYLMRVYLMRVYLMGRVPHGACTSWGVYLMGRVPHGGALHSVCISLTRIL
jgi:hypothetical protein